MHDYILSTNRAFELISYFPYLIILLSGYVIKWGFNSYILIEIKLLHRRWGRKAMHDYDRTTYQRNIFTYRNLYFNIPLINRAFQAISCFSSLITLLTGNAIKWGIRSYLLAEIKLHTISIFLHTIWKLLHTIWKLLHTQEIF